MSQHVKSLHELVSRTRAGETVRFRAENSTIDYQTRERVSPVDQPAQSEGRRPTIVGFALTVGGSWEAESVDPILGSTASWVRLRRLA
jgi:hypothetical protein